MKPFSVAINAGGRSRRMGRDKALVELDGRPMLAHVLERVKDLGQAQTLLVSNDHNAHARFGLPMVRDSLPEGGSLGGIYTALLHSRYGHTLVVACDMPFLSPALLRHMLALREEGEYDVIVPRVDGYPQGLHAVYSQACIAPIRAQIESGRLRVIGFHDQVRVRTLDEAEWQPLDPDGRALHNLNTPAELAASQSTQHDATGERQRESTAKAHAAQPGATDARKRKRPANAQSASRDTSDTTRIKKERTGKASKFLIVLGYLLLAVVSVFAVQTHRELETTNIELEDTREQLAASNREQRALREELNVANVELEDTREELDATSAELEEARLKIAGFHPPVYLNEGENLLLTSVHNLFLREEKLEKSEKYKYRFTGSIGMGVGHWAFNLVWRIDENFASEEFESDYTATPDSCVRVLRWDQYSNPMALNLTCEAAIDWTIQTLEPVHALDIMPLKDHDALMEWIESAADE